jgi:succinate dehydrogenase / fumarate reductase, cytochrome b subunit
MSTQISGLTPGSPAVPAPRSQPSRRRTLYRGDPGMWSWVLHRITGATIFFFLFVHVLDTALVRVSPQAYNEVIETYKTPIVGLMEMGLVVAVVYHALNGIRVILIDFWQHGAKYQRAMLWGVVAVTLAVLIPSLAVLGMHMAERFL